MNSMNLYLIDGICLKHVTSLYPVEIVHKEGTCETNNLYFQVLHNLPIIIMMIIITIIHIIKMIMIITIIIVIIIIKIMIITIIIVIIIMKIMIM